MSFLYACLMRSVCLWNLNPNGLALFRSCFIFYIGVTLTSCFFPVVSAFNCLFSKFLHCEWQCKPLFAVQIIIKNEIK